MPKPISGKSLLSENIFRIQKKLDEKGNKRLTGTLHIQQILGCRQRLKQKYTEKKRNHNSHKPVFRKACCASFLADHQ